LISFDYPKSNTRQELGTKRSVRLAVRVAVEKMGGSKISKVAGTKGKRKILQH